MARQESWDIVLTKPAEKDYDHVTGELQEQFDHCFAALEDNPLYGTNIGSLTIVYHVIGINHNAL